MKELAKRRKHVIELRQFNPDLRLCVELKDVEAIHKVLGELI
jgi:hypothetical protein